MIITKSNEIKEREEKLQGIQIKHCNQIKILGTIFNLKANQLTHNSFLMFMEYTFDFIKKSPLKII